MIHSVICNYCSLSTVDQKHDRRTSPMTTNATFTHRRASASETGLDSLHKAVNWLLTTGG